MVASGDRIEVVGWVFVSIASLPSTVPVRSYGTYPV